MEGEVAPTALLGVAMATPFPQLTGAAGAAFRLDVPSSTSVQIQHPNGNVTLREGAPYVTITLHSCHDVDAVRMLAWSVVQEALDLLAARSRIALATSLGEQEFLTWFDQDSGLILTLVDTTCATWSANITVQGSPSPFPPQPIPFVHHAALRFYRLSQISSDLFDAYRNAYLSLECLLSDVSARISSERELDWLKRVVSTHFSSAVPSGIDANAALDSIYKKGRNPTFHAKSGETFYSPLGEERQEIQAQFETLTILLTSLLRHKFGSHNIGGWGHMSKAVHDAQARTTFSFDEIIFKSAYSAISQLPRVVIHENPRRFSQLWASLSVERPITINELHSIEIKRRGDEWMHMVLPEPVPLEGVETVALELNLMQFHHKAPRPGHPR